MFCCVLLLGSLVSILRCCMGPTFHWAAKSAGMLVSNWISALRWRSALRGAGTYNAGLFVGVGVVVVGGVVVELSHLVFFSGAGFVASGFELGAM